MQKQFAFFIKHWKHKSICAGSKYAQNLVLLASSKSVRYIIVYKATLPLLIHCYVSNLPFLIVVYLSSSVIRRMKGRKGKEKQWRFCSLHIQAEKWVILVESSRLWNRLKIGENQQKSVSTLVSIVQCSRHMPCKAQQPKGVLMILYRVLSA